MLFQMERCSAELCQSLHDNGHLLLIYSNDVLLSVDLEILLTKEA